MLAYREKLHEVMDGIKMCGSKMKTACLFIDFFIHDVLDYTVLNNNRNNFVKTLETFEVYEVINTVI
jgi:hypothetical protein